MEVDGNIAIPLQRKVRQIHRRWLSSTNGSNKSIEYNSVPLGVGIGTHYAEIYLGLPPQKASVIVDTGSHMTALPCTSCIDCGEHTDPPYDVAKSTTANYLTCAEYGQCYSCELDRCRVTQRYQEGSRWSALMINELTWIGTLDDSNPDFFLKRYGIRFPIGCQTEETGLFITQKENGIIGMSQHPDTIVPYLKKAGILRRNIFSLCFAETGGTMVLGGVDSRLHTAPPMYTPLLHSSGWFTVEVLDILIGNTSIGVSPSWYNGGRGVIVDSGSTDTYFPSSIYSSFNDLYFEKSGRRYREEESFHLSLAEQHLLPDIHIVLRGKSAGSSVILTIPPTQYYTTQEDGTVSNNIHLTQSSGGVLGASTLMNFNVIFDMETQVVGFAPAQCDANSHTKNQPGISKGKWKDKTFWESYGAILTVAFICSFLGLAFFTIRFIWRQCRKRQWTEISTEDKTPRHQVSPLSIQQENGDEDMHTPVSPQRRLSRSPELHIIQEDEDES